MVKILDEIALSFDDVLLQPQKSSGISRKLVSLETNIGSIFLKIPIIAANMPSVCETDMAVSLGKLGGLGIIHRMQSIESESCMVYEAKTKLGGRGYVGAAIGIGEDWLVRANELIKSGVDIICLDVAHGYQDSVCEIHEEFLEKFPECPLIVGNIATAEAAQAFSDNAILKVGIGGGSVCTTRIKTGCGVPTFQSVIDVASSKKCDIVADGGIKTSGDIVKSIAAGAKVVMLGNLLAGTDEAPGEIIKGIDGNKYKIYRGAASFGAKREFFGQAEYIEGEETLIPYRGPVEKVILKLCEGIRSGLSYCGSVSLNELQEKSRFIRITSAGYKESIAHGLL
jgi:IMP dehydrogenase